MVAVGRANEGIGALVVAYSGGNRLSIDSDLGHEQRLSAVSDRVEI